MNAVSRTLYIPLYGKALVSRQGKILNDPSAEAIWAKEGFALHAKARSKWLAYFMGMRSAVIDQWTQNRLTDDTLVLHLGCGLDARCERVARKGRWYDVDLPEVIEVRKQHFSETANYYMLGADLTAEEWLDALPQSQRAVVVMEGVSMYLPQDALFQLCTRLKTRFAELELILDAYTSLAVHLSNRGNPIRTVGAQACTGLDNPHAVPLEFVQQLSMTPEDLIAQLKRSERFLFRHVYEGRMAAALYRL